MTERAESGGMVTLEERVNAKKFEREGLVKLPDRKGAHRDSRPPEEGQAAAQAAGEGPLTEKAAGGSTVAGLHLERGFSRLAWGTSLSLAFFFAAEAVSAWSTDRHAAHGFLAFAVPSFIAPWIVFFVARWIARGFIGGPKENLVLSPVRAKPADAIATRLGQRTRDVLPRLAFFSRDQRRRQNAHPTPSDMPC